MRLRWILVISLCLTAMAIPASGQKKGDSAQTTAVVTPYSGVRRDNLLNGLQIVTLEKADENLFRCYLVVRAGAMYDVVGKTGVVALTQRALLAVNPALREEMESLQTKIDWGVTSDTTWFRLEGPPGNFESVMEILARLLVVDAVRAEAFKKAQSEQIAKVRQGLTAAQAADEAFLKAIYGDHPYGHNIEGSELTLSGLRQGDLYDVFQRFYLANNASAVVTGKIPAERVVQAFKVFFGGWSKGATVPATFRAPVAIGQAKTVRIEDPKAERIELRGGVNGVKYGSPEYPMTRIMASILAERWRKEGGGAEVVFAAERRHLAGPIWFSASLKTAEARGVTQKVSEVFNSIGGAVPITAAELAAAKSEVLAEYRQRSPEDWLREIEIYQLARNIPLTAQARVEAITLEEVQGLAKRLLEANALTVVVLGRLGEAFKATP